MYFFRKLRLLLLVAGGQGFFYFLSSQLVLKSLKMPGAIAVQGTDSAKQPR